MRPRSAAHYAVYMGYDSAATRARLLDAAYDEFVERGLAGARVDRIASHAAANKQAIYAYFGSKDALFDAVLDDRLRDLSDLVPFTPGDVSGYIGRLFDELVGSPGLVRLTQWKTLERTGPSPREIEALNDKAHQMSSVHDIEVEVGADIVMLVLAMVQAWNTTYPAVRNPSDADESERLATHRRSLLTAVAALANDLIKAPAIS